MAATNESNEISLTFGADHNLESGDIVFIDNVNCSWWCRFNKRCF